jgi:hypothetical protein
VRDGAQEEGVFPLLEVLHVHFHFLVRLHAVVLDQASGPAVDAPLPSPAGVVEREKTARDRRRRLLARGTATIRR